MATRIFIVDDHALVRGGLCQLIAKDSELFVIGQASHGAEAVKRLSVDSPDLLLVDLRMEGFDGTRVIRTAKKLDPEIRVMALTAYTDPSYVRAALLAGADGYIVKSESAENILRAIHCVLDGYSYLSPEVTQEVIRGFVASSESFDKRPFSSLTTREREIADVIIRGNTRNKDIAGILFISERTVERHKSNIFRKLKVSDTQALLGKFSHVESWE